MMVIGAVSAESTDALSDSQNGLPIGNGISDIVADADDSSSTGGESSSLSSGGSDSVSVKVKVNYEYADDANKLVPDFYII